MAPQLVSVVKPQIVSVGFSVCRDKAGSIIFSAHNGGDRILLEVSEEECQAFARDLAAFCGARVEVESSA